MDNNNNNHMNSKSLKRLYRDYKELVFFPLLNAAAQPNEDNAFIWHANLFGSGRCKGLIVHLILDFPSDYPCSPPSVYVTTPLPHPNLYSIHSLSTLKKSKIPSQFHKYYYICLDMLNTNNNSDGWSSSYTVSSILTQLASFLVNGGNEQEDNGNGNNNNEDHTNLLFSTNKEVTDIKQAIERSKNFTCTCNHTYNLPIPGLSDNNNNHNNKNNDKNNCNNNNSNNVFGSNTKIELIITRPKISFPDSVIQFYQKTKNNSAKVKSQSQSVKPVASPNPLVPAQSQSQSQSQSQAQAQVQVQVPKDFEWQTVTHKKKNINDTFNNYHNYKNKKKSKYNQSANNNIVKVPSNNNKIITPQVSNNNNTIINNNKTSNNINNKPIVFSVSSLNMIWSDLNEKQKNEEKKKIEMEKAERLAIKLELAKEYIKNNNVDHNSSGSLESVMKEMWLNSKSAKRHAQRAKKRANAKLQTNNSKTNTIIESTNNNVNNSPVHIDDLKKEKEKPEEKNNEEKTDNTSNNINNTSNQKDNDDDGFILVNKNNDHNNDNGKDEIIDNNNNFIAMLEKEKESHKTVSTKQLFHLVQKDNNTNNNNNNNNNKKVVSLLTGVPIRVVLVHIFSFLDALSVCRLSMVSHSMRSISETGYLWRNFFQKKFNKSLITPSNLMEWKYCYLLEQNQIIASLHCFHSKENFNDTVLGIPLTFTVNPKTKNIDYITSTFDMLSYDSFKFDKVRKSVNGSSFTNWLPLYIESNHWERARPLVRASLLQLSTNNKPFDSYTIIDVLPKIVNTLTVLLSDKGLHASELACEGFISIHRIILAMCMDIPNTSQIALSMLNNFMNDDYYRTKERTPALGHLLPLLLMVNPGACTWSKLSTSYLNEYFARSVIWICKEYPQLSDVNYWDSSNDKRAGVINDNHLIDWFRLEKSFECMKVGLRLLMFHVNFLKLFHNNNLDVTCHKYDMFYGRASTSDKKSFTGLVKKILNITTWQEFFNMIYIQPPSPVQLTKTLKEAVSLSLKRKYHNNATDFTKIHSHGVSKILLAGESYSAAPNLTNLLFQDSWSFDGAGTFLDATIIITDQQANRLDYVDYAKRFTGPDMGESIVHSGDEMDYVKHEGRHDVSINVKKLPVQAHYLFFVLSAWSGTLKAIKQPWIKFSDSDNHMELCRYDLHAKGSSLGSNTGVIMCCMIRSKLTGGSWTVKALGQLTMGTARDYTPILNQIKLMKAKELF